MNKFLEFNFKKHKKSYQQFGCIEDPPSRRPYICALIHLDKLVPDTKELFNGYVGINLILGVDPEKLAAVATEQDILYLIRCGVRYMGGDLMLFGGTSKC